MGKIDFENLGVVMTTKEMKEVKGGNKVPHWCCFSDGECVLTGCTSSSDCVGWYGEGKCD